MTSQLARIYRIEVAKYVAGLDVTDPSIIWTRFNGVNDFDPQVSPTMESTDDYESNGWTGNEKTMQSGVWTIKGRRPFDGGVYDAGQEIVRRAQIKFGDDGRVFARYYDRTSTSGEARAGVFVVDWSITKTGVSNIQEVTAKLSNDGEIKDIQNPFTPTAAPVVSGATPTGRSAGQIVTVTGTGFVGATAVRFGSTNATDFRVLSDSTLTAVVPTGTAGSAAVSVTNAIGTSNSFPYTRGS